MRVNQPRLKGILIFPAFGLPAVQKSVWGLIILKDSTFEFHLVLFQEDELRSEPGKIITVQKGLKAATCGNRGSQHTNRPQLDTDGVKIAISGQPNLWAGGQPFKQLSPSLIEAFLDDWHRSKILTAINDDGQRRKILPWLQANGLAVYRQLEKAGRRTLEEAVFPPALDFLEEA